MNKYTPGPWEAVVNIQSNDKRCLVRQKRSERGYICQPTNMHNANLIAAAPEMYDALEEARNALWVAKRLATGDSPLLDTLIMGVEKAMAKAEGVRD